MKAPKDVEEILGTYTARIDGEASRFLAHGSSSMYGMMRYFMGYTDELFQDSPDVFGGKRFRSGLCLLLADSYGVLEEAVPAALSIELFHNFTLIHDDIVDHDEFRRGRKTVWNIWGVDHAINTGDGQFVLAVKALEHLDPAYRGDVRAALIDTYLEVIEGQHLDFSLTAYSLDDARVTDASYMDMLTKKTSVLVAAAARTVGTIAGVPKEEADALWQYGLSLGLAYQLCDDAVSIWAGAEVTGKKSHGDIREKKKTFTILFAKEKLSPTEKEQLVSFYTTKEPLRDSEVDRVIELLDSVDAYAQTRARIEHYRDEACRMVGQLSVSDEYAETLVRLVDVLLPDVRRV
jgi:geranylgeranyl diphosphate synthase type II